MIRLAIVEDNKLVAENLADIISSFDEFDVTFIAHNGIELLEHLKIAQPQLVIMDIQMPLMNGIEAVKVTRELYPAIKIIMHTVLNNDEAIIESIMLGANGYILKNEKPQKLIDAIKDVLDGGAPITPSIAQKLIKYLNFSNNQKNKIISYDLSNREFEILELISQGLPYKLIADKLSLSVKTVGKHIENIYTKLHVNNKIEAINVFKTMI